MVAVTSMPMAAACPAAHPVARVVKQAENADNMDLSRIAVPT
jgi:hypothetical protein